MLLWNAMPLRLTVMINKETRRTYLLTYLPYRTWKQRYSRRKNIFKDIE